MEKNIVIFGAGVAGLTAAHALIKRGIKVSIHEKNDNIGGLVRTPRVNGYPTEHTPRVFLPPYINFYKIIKEIPLMNNKNKSVYDNLNKHGLKDVIYSKDEKIQSLFRRMISLPKSDLLYISYILCKGIFSGDSRIKCYDKVNFDKYLRKDKSKKLFNIINLIAGETLDNFSLYKMIKLVEYEINYKLGFYGKNVPTTFQGPYTETWFSHWEAYLKKKGVKFFKNSSLESLNLKNNRIESAIIKKSNNLFKITGDKFILALDISSLRKVLINSKINILDPLVLQLNALYSKTYSEQLTVQLYFKEEIKLDFVGYFALDSDWKFIIGPQNMLWSKNIFKGNGVKSIWSICIPDIYLYSNRLKKKAKYCKPNELFDEILYQLNSCLRKVLKKNNLKKFTPIHKTIWKSWKFENNKFITDEPYFFNTTNTLHLRPHPTTPIKNLFLSGSFTNTSYYNYYVEGAVESGLNVASLILNKNLVYKHNRISFLRLIYKVDDLLYKFKLPNIVDSISIILIFYIIHKYYKKKFN